MLAKPAQRALQNAGILKLEELTKVREAELLQLHGMGRNALGQLRRALRKRGWSFREPKKNKSKLLSKSMRVHFDR